LGLGSGAVEKLSGESSVDSGQFIQTLWGVGGSLGTFSNPPQGSCSRQTIFLRTYCFGINLGPYCPHIFLLLFNMNFRSKIITLKKKLNIFTLTTT
jgi:hypothetical protein